MKDYQLSVFKTAAPDQLLFITAVLYLRASPQLQPDILPERKNIQVIKYHRIGHFANDPEDSAVL